MEKRRKTSLRLKPMITYVAYLKLFLWLPRSKHLGSDPEMSSTCEAQFAKLRPIFRQKHSQNPIITITTSVSKVQIDLRRMKECMSSHFLGHQLVINSLLRNYVIIRKVPRIVSFHFTYFLRGEKQRDAYKIQNLLAITIVSWRSEMIMKARVPDAMDWCSFCISSKMNLLISFRNNLSSYKHITKLLLSVVD